MRTFALFLSLLFSLIAHSSPHTDNDLPLIKSPSPLPQIATEPVLEINVLLGDKVDVGNTDDGHRYIVPITGGSFQGNDIRGHVVPGGADWQVDRPDKVKNIEALYTIKTHDGTTIIIHNKGIVHHLTGSRYAFTRPVFHAPKGQYDWLNTSFFVGTIQSRHNPRSVVISVYEVR
ncbi:conserved exported hypothetical protein [Alteromonas sp. 38]|uniref:DUF3237 domain-containing protein n=1 Tax=unclassified Alteromonas TaxID=2614992 RepID=UPI0012F45D68|nr:MULTISPECIES: DUF3237 domain-containing protein [unclassified Alteromonas]CAD5282592.1 conserved exported hypothetical protein [Alteromonas sp. 154]VXB89829.1 conserved exported hypothetical protein [Alteromonas sp. 38]